MTERLKENENLKGSWAEITSKLSHLQTQTMKTETNIHKLELDKEAKTTEIKLLKD